MAVTLYVKGDCPYCRSLREQLESQRQAFRLIDIDDSPQSVAELRKLTGGRRIVPVLVDGASLVVAPEGGTEF